jgi:hypothetical protein
MFIQNVGNLFHNHAVPEPPPSNPDTACVYYALECILGPDLKFNVRLAVQFLSSLHEIQSYLKTYYIIIA